MLTQEQLAGLREKAEDVSKLFSGVWNLQPIDHKKNVLRMSVAKPEGIPWYKTGEACADFCTACNPATILKLLEMVKRLEKEADWLAEQLVQELHRISKKRFQGAIDETGECYRLYGSRQEAMKSWREYAQQAASKAVEAFE